LFLSSYEFGLGPQEELKGFLVEQPNVSNDLQPFDFDTNLKLLQENEGEEEGGGSITLQAVDGAISNIADSRRWSFHKDMLLEYLTNMSDVMTLEGRLLVGIVARQILLRCKAQVPPNKSVAQELFVKLKGDSDKSKSIALFITAKWPNQMFEQVKANIPSQPDNDLRIQILKVGFQFVENSFVIDTAKKVDLLKSRNLLWADFAQIVYQWAFQNTVRGTTRVMQAAEKTKNHLQKLGATFSVIEPVPTISDWDSNNITKAEHVLADEDELKRIEAKKSLERRADMRSKMRRGTSASISAPSPAPPAVRLSVPSNALLLPRSNRPPGPARHSEPTDQSYLHTNAVQQEFSAVPHSSALTIPFAATTPGHDEDKINTGADFQTSNNNPRQDQNQDPQYQTARPGWEDRVSHRLPLQDEAVKRQDQSRDHQQSLNGRDTGWEDRVSQRPSLQYDEQRRREEPRRHDQDLESEIQATRSTGWEERISQRPSIRNDEARHLEPQLPIPRPRWEERVALRPSLNGDKSRHYDDGKDDYYTTTQQYEAAPAQRQLRNHDDDYERRHYDAVPNSQPFPSTSGYDNNDRMRADRNPVAPTNYSSLKQTSSFLHDDDTSQRFRDGTNNSYPPGESGGQERRKRQRSESPSFDGGGDSGRGRGRGIEFTKPAWMKAHEQKSNHDFPEPSFRKDDKYNDNDSNNTNYHNPDASLSGGGGGRGRGRHQTAPAWMTRDQKVQGLTSERSHSTPQDAGVVSLGRGRGRHQTQPAWMTQHVPNQDQQAGPTSRPIDTVALAAGAGRGRGHGRTLPAWMTQQQQEQ
jgi:hypothetical protein